MSTGDSLTEVYVFENSQLLEQLEEVLLNSEKNSVLEKAHIDEVFRVMHTIKGSSAMMGYDGLTKLAHGMEDMFSPLRQNPDMPKDIREQVINLVLECIDFFKGEIAKIQEGLLPDGEIAALHDRSVALQKLLTGAADEPAAPAVIAMPGDPDPSEAAASGSPAAAPGGLRYYKSTIHFSPGCSMESVRAFALVNSLDGLYNRIAHVPKDLNVNCDEAIVSGGFTLYLETACEGSELEPRIAETLFLQSMSFSEMEPQEIQSVFPGAQAPQPEAAQPEVKAEEPQPKAEAPKAQAAAPAQPKAEAPKAAPASHGSTQSFLSVNVGKVDKLMDLVGEIVTTESMVTKHPDIVSQHIESFEKQARRLRQLTDDLQDVVMSIRMVPISSTFRKMQRIVRDMCHKTGKEAELVLLGEQTEVDKNIVENLSDPLMHMVRNSMDHGIETVEERLAKGKPAGGTIVLEARNTGGDVIITVSDDGQGLDRTKIIKKAQDRGLTTKADSEISDREAYNFIMAPGFSTNDQVTEYSGRGVGMDVVCSNLEKMGGTVSVDSVPGNGTTFTLHIPLTLAIIDGMEVTVGNEHFIIPILNIQQSFELKDQDLIVEPDGSESIIIRGQAYHVRRLNQLFSIPEGRDNLQDGILMLLDSERGSICLFVDHIVGEQQAVIKPLPAFINKILGRLPYISGCTIMGNGGISLIMDVNGLTSSVSN